MGAMLGMDTEVGTVRKYPCHTKIARKVVGVSATPRRSTPHASDEWWCFTNTRKTHAARGCRLRARVDYRTTARAPRNTHTPQGHQAHTTLPPHKVPHAREALCSSEAQRRSDRLLGRGPVKKENSFPGNFCVGNEKTFFQRFRVPRLRWIERVFDTTTWNDSSESGTTTD